MPRVHLNLGSNRGDSKKNLSRACELLLDKLGSTISTVRKSRVIMSDPWGYSSENRFSNMGLSFETDIPSLKLLEITQCVERETGGPDDFHRNPDGTYRDRLIDIDIIFYGHERLNHPKLTLPHPLMQERRFVLQPIAEIDPLWRHPDNGLSAAEMLREGSKSM